MARIFRPRSLASIPTPAGRLGTLVPMAAVAAACLAVTGCGGAHPGSARRDMFGRSRAALSTGATACPAGEGLTLCNGSCVATARDPLDCGACNIRCGAGQVCSLGICTTHFEARGIMGDPGSWTEYGPNLGGRLSGVFAADVSGSRYILVTSPGGGVWRTTTGAAPWSEPLHYGFANFSATHIERDRNNASRLYAMTTSDVYSTTDYGDHWADLTLTGSTPPPLLPPGSVPEPSDPRPFAQMCCSWDGSGNCTSTRVFAGFPCEGLRYSMDSGATFSQEWPFTGYSGNYDNCLAGIAAEDNVPGGGRVYIATMAHGGPTHVYASDPTCNWCTSPTPCTGDWEPAWGSGTDVLPTLTDGNASRIAWTGNATYPHRVSVVAGDGGSVYSYQTTDGGLTNTSPNWTQGHWTKQAQAYVNSDGRGLLWAGGQRLFTDSGGLGFESTGNFGTTPWSCFAVGGCVYGSPEHFDTRAVFADASLQKVYSVNDGAGATGTEWNITQWDWTGPSSDPSNGSGIDKDGLHVWQAYNTASTFTSGGGLRVWVGSQDNGFVCTEDGLNWTPVYDGDGYWVGLHPVDTDRGYMLLTQGLYKATQATSAADCASVGWGAVSTPGVPREAGPDSIALDPRSGQQDVLVYASTWGLAISTDAGSTFQPATGLPYPDSVYVDDQGYLYAGMEGAGVEGCDTPLPSPPPTGSTPASLACLSASHWRPVGSFASPPRYITAVRESHPSGADPTFWAGTTGGLFRMTPGGNWTLVTGGGGYTVNEVETIPGYPNCVYAGLGFVAEKAQHRGGVRFSSDGGTNWVSITAGLDVHETPVSDILPIGSLGLFVTTYGRGFWSYSPLPTVCGGSG